MVVEPPLLIAIATLPVLVALALIWMRTGRGDDGSRVVEALREQAEAARRDVERLERALRAELAAGREEAAAQGRGLREEVAASLKNVSDSLLRQMADVGRLQKDQLDGFARQIATLTEQVNARLAELKTDSAAHAKTLRDEVAASLRHFADTMLAHMGQVGELQKSQLATFAQQIGKLTESNEQRQEALRVTVTEQLKTLQTESAAHAKTLRDEVAASLRHFADTMLAHMGQAGELQKGQLEAFAQQIGKLTESNDQRQEALRRTVEEQLKALQADNAAKLEQMRHTVDEKLQGTLEKRLGDSFKLVSDRLEQVHKGLGEMQTLANGVGDLKKVLTNVKTRGNWGEIQLGNLLEQVLTTDQYLREATTRPGSGERVEFAIRLPGRGDGDREVLLPIDAKFPREDYERLVDAADRADAEGVELAARALETRIRNSARDIRDKYLNPPLTTDFAILFLPTEGLYAEVLRRPNLVETLQRDYRVSLAGPTTLLALLNSLQMGFRTLAIQKRSSEVWEILGAVKTEFGKYGDVLDKVQKKLQEATNTIEHVAVRKRAIDRKLRHVQALPAVDAQALLGVDEAAEELEPAE